MFKNMVLALERIERRQRLILERLERMEKRPDEGIGPYGGAGGPDKGNRWLESGIDNILAYQVGGKRDEKE